MARKTAIKTGTTVPNGTILVNCMKPCAKCETLSRFIHSRLRTWVKGLGYALVYNSQSEKTSAYWQTYGKPRKVKQVTPQIYAVKTQKQVSGAAIVPRDMVGTYKIPPVKSWDTEMVKDIIKMLISLCE